MTGKTILISAVFLLAAGGLAAWGMGVFDGSAANQVDASGGLSPEASVSCGSTAGGCCPMGGGSADAGHAMPGSSACPAAGFAVGSADSGCCPSSEKSEGAARAECSACPSLKAGGSADAGCSSGANCGRSDCMGDSMKKECADCPVAD